MGEVRLPAASAGRSLRVMIKRRSLGARAARARIGSGGGGGTPKWLGLLALALLAACLALAVDLGPSRAQVAGIPASVTIDEDHILGSLAVRSYFLVRGQVRDANGDLVQGADSNGQPIPSVGAPAWSASDGSSRAAYLIGGLSVFSGQAYATYLVARAGEVTITLTVASVSASITLQLGEPVDSPPPEPSSIMLASPFTSRLASDNPNQVTVTALVTDANGATAPDGTPVEWETWRFQDRPHPVDEEGLFWVPISVDRTTTNGTATGTWRKASVTGTNTNPVLVVARAGPAVGAVLTEANRSLQAAPKPAAIEIIEHPSRWESIAVGESVTLRARLTDLNGAPVPDGEEVHWRWHEEGRALALGREDVFANTPTGGANSRPTTNGVASATFTANHEGFVWVRAYEISGGSERYLLDVIAFNVGDYRPPPADLALRLRLLDDSDDIVPIGSTLRVGAELTYGGYGELDQALHITEGALRVTGALEWETSRTSFRVPAQSALTRRTVLREHLAWHGGRTGRGAEAGAAGGQCKGVSDEGETAWTCTLDIGDSSIEVLPGTPPGVYTISGVLSVNGREYHDTLEVTVVGKGSIDEVAEVSFDFAPQERGANRGEPYPSTIAVGESTELRLTALNEHGAASAAGSISAILLTTTTGSLSTTLGDGCADGDGISCRVPVSAVSASNADQIPIRLTHPGADQAGITTVRARVISADGEVFSPPPLSVTFKGAADSLAISAPATGLLGLATGGDDRDLLKLTVTATDADGNDVDVPYRAPRAVIRGPDGKQVSSGLSVVWTEDGPDDDEVHDRFARNAANAVEATIRATAAAEAPLATGEYTLELRTGGKSATRTFSVVGAVDSVTLGEPQGVLEAGRIVSLSATFRDAGGTLAPDGTRVEWTRRDAGDSAVLVQLSAEQVTTDGAAAAEFLAVSAGTAIVTVEADGVGDVRLIAIAEAPPAVAADAPPPRLIDNLTNIVAGGFSAWFGDEATTASALFNELTGVGAVMLWQNGAWLSYSGADSADFAINPGVVLWLER